MPDSALLEARGEAIKVVSEDVKGHDRMAPGDSDRVPVCTDALKAESSSPILAVRQSERSTARIAERLIPSRFRSSTTCRGTSSAVLVRKAESGYVAYCPGVGGVYEEGATREEAFEHACVAACAIFEARRIAGVVLTKDGPFGSRRGGAATEEAITRARRACWPLAVSR
jgi:hypothetical protein